MKFTLSINSHSLTNFQRCESYYLFNDLVGIEPIKKREALSKGTLVGRYLNLYYYNKIKPKRLFSKCLGNALFWVYKFSKELEWSQTQAFDLFQVLVKYHQTYKSETWKPVAIESGFSKTLYEDEDNLIVYEGRVDLVIEDSGKLKPVDHKTEKHRNPIYEFNNQAIGYCWALGSTEFIYNYLTLTKVPEFYRQVHPISQAQIDSWITRTTDWAFRIKAAIVEKVFLPSMQCVSQYGRCPFSLICEQPKDDIKKFIIGANYKTRKPYRSW